MISREARLRNIAEVFSDWEKSHETEVEPDPAFSHSDPSQYPEGIVAVSATPAMDAELMDRLLSPLVASGRPVATGRLDEQSWELKASTRSFLTESLTSAGKPSTPSVMVALVPPVEVSRALMEAASATEPLEDQHITLLYLGTCEEVGDQKALRDAVTAWAAGQEPMTGQVTAWEVFTNPDENVLVALWDLPTLDRAALLEACTDKGVPLRTDDHPFNPHQTMRYESQPPQAPADLSPWPSADFGQVVISWGEYPWFSIPLGTVLTAGGEGKTETY